MTPNAYTDDEGPSVPRSVGAPGFDCPRCSGTLRRDHHSIRCAVCEYTPLHGAD